MQEAIEARLAAAGYDHYETSAFAQTRHHCRHNLNYWHFGDYLGIGAGAHSKLTLHDRVLRQMRWKHPEAYLEKVSAGQSVQEETAIATDQLPIEFLMNALRLAQGFTVSQYEARTGTPFAPLVSQVRRLTEEGLLSVEADRIAPTPRGRRFLNVLLEKFLPDA
jgi:oxygen-independent coproporphyrinogen-3 oxidase